MSDNDNKDLKGLGGWLILVGIGVVLSPVKLLLTSVQIYKPIFEDGTWEALTTAGTPYYHAYWAPMIVGEIIFNTLMIVASLVLIYLFFKKHYLFPKVYIALALITLVFIPLDSWMVTFIMPDEPVFDPDTTKEFTRSLVAAMIWVPYMLVSKRVKATFVENRTADKPGQGTEVPA